MSFSPSTKYYVKRLTDGCTHYYFRENDNGMGIACEMGKCDKCGTDVEYWNTASISVVEKGVTGATIKEYKGKDLVELFEAVGLKRLDHEPDGCSNVEDYSDEYQTCCDECAGEIMDEYYNKD